ncbi:glutaminyl-peptide cyclotransferase [Methanosarcina sp.]|uniref:glutaminyl-peptide cyclotransferase n=1 Tax=Methanosarcina sp. TaxID=2213 RepID=UPI00298962C2|nr:glutaminyl-peptide cyclotransferase [Methanosarcina sp.]MDW5550158.1 glutaminyl-peptide cyclotransferase [Methanosarcina sp.]MDW5555311.1 glutaminyl-peptide cyclotransferase [Methanosarcina sp.]MDW5560536.1 glutaminyl-peptide cyclotransferase [Methanosarcina sp.]
MKLDETRRVYSLIGVLGITLMFFLMLVSTAGSSPFAYITNTGSKNVSVIDTATNTVTAMVKVGDSPYGVAVNPNGKRVYVTNCGNDTVPGNTVSVIDTATNMVIATVKVGNNPLGVAVSPDGTRAYVANDDDGTVSVIDTATNTVTATVHIGYGIFGVAVSPDGTRIYVTNWNSETVSVIDTATNTVTAVVPVGTGTFGVAVSPDGTKVYVTNSGSHTVSVIDAATNNVTATVKVGVGSYPRGVVVTPDGTKVYVANHGSNAVSVIDTKTNKVTATILERYPDGVAVTPDGTKVYVANEAFHTVSVIDTTTNKETAMIYVGGNPVAFGQFIGPFSLVPFANFSAKPTEGKVPLTVAFTDESIRSPTKWKWTFGDGTTSNKQNPTHKYSKLGRYTVTLTATNDNGSSTETKTNYIKVVTKPVANFTSSVTYGKAPLNVKFTDTSTGTPTKWIWNFGDGSKSVLQNPTHKYSKAGIYTVNLTVNNTAGRNTVTKTDYIIVVAKPVAEFSAKPTKGKAPLTVAFNDTSTGSPIKWRWSFGDETISTKQNPTHKYSKAGIYTVVLTATNYNGSNMITKTDYLKVIEKPVTNFSASPTSIITSRRVQFTDTSTGVPTEWKWDFGDGVISTYYQNPRHTYSKAGNYTVSLKVENAAGRNTTTKKDYINVIDPVKPVVNFSATPTEGKAPLTVAFNDSSTGIPTPTVWLWFFGDGTSSRIQNPKHVYSKAGNYTVILGVRNSAGSNKVIKTNYIKVTT